MSISYMVEDDTGRMEAVHYHEESTIPALRNTFVKIIGVLKSGREQNMVTVYRLSTIQDMNEVMAHQLELVVTPLRIKKQQQMAAGVAHASLMGMTQVSKTGHGGDGRHLAQHGPGQQPHIWFTQTFSQPAKPAAVPQHDRPLLRTPWSPSTSLAVRRGQTST